MSECDRPACRALATTGDVSGDVRAVRTTGIYCHPECGAAPDPRNVHRYGSAAAAEADGYRACLRCRPYRRSDPASGPDAPDLVCRAVRLVVAGALDGGNEADLGRRLGVSARHLRRLFVEHVGTTPDHLARSRRAHFARRLLDDTDLGVSDVAFAAGFGSVRQFSRTMRDVFRASPTELRARRRQTDRLVADGGLECRVPFTPPLDWTRLLAFFSARAAPGVESVEGDTYRRTLRSGEAVGAVEIRRGGPDHLVARFHLPHWHDLIHHVATVRRLFDLDLDPSHPGRVLAADPALAPWPDGLRVPGAWDPLEAGVRAILGQQVSVASATTTAGRIAATAGTPVHGLDALGLSRAFPTARQLSDAELPVPARRAAAIRTFAAEMEHGSLRLDGSRSLAELERSLCALPGVGPWTAQYLALRLGERDAFPTRDLVLRRRLAERPGADPDRWRPWRAHAAVRLWTG